MQMAFQPHIRHQGVCFPPTLSQAPPKTSPPLFPNYVLKIQCASTFISQADM